MAEENKLLRSLLLQRGVPESEIDDYLGRSFDQPQITSGLTTLDSMLSARKPCCGERTGRSLHLSASSSSSVHVKPISTSLPVVSNASAHDQHRPGIAWSDLSPTTSTQSYPNTDVVFNVDEFSRTGHEYHPATSDLWSGPASYAFSEEINAGADMSSCTFATNIIRDMGAGVSSEQVKAELGCASNMDCKVGNSTLFRVMDRHSGQ